MISKEHGETKPRTGIAAMAVASPPGLEWAFCTRRLSASPLTINMLFLRLQKRKGDENKIDDSIGHRKEARAASSGDANLASALNCATRVQHDSVSVAEPSQIRPHFQLFWFLQLGPTGLMARVS